MEILESSFVGIVLIYLFFFPDTGNMGFSGFGNANKRAAVGNGFIINTSDKLSPWNHKVDKSKSSSNISSLTIIFQQCTVLSG